MKEWRKQRQRWHHRRACFDCNRDILIFWMHCKKNQSTLSLSNQDESKIVILFNLLSQIFNDLVLSCNLTQQIINLSFLCCYLLLHLSAIDSRVFNLLFHFTDVIFVYLDIKNEKTQLLLNILFKFKKYLTLSWIERKIMKSNHHLLDHKFRIRCNKEWRKTCVKLRRKKA